MQNAEYGLAFQKDNGNHAKFTQVANFTKSGGWYENPD